MKPAENSKNKFCFIIIAVLVCLIAVKSRSAYAENRGLGAGIIIGEPTGISIKYGSFPVIGIAWSIDDRFRVHCDYWIFRDSLRGGFGWFAGLGGKYIYDDDAGSRGNRDDEDRTNLGIRVPAGVNYFFKERLEAFIEVVPGIMLYPSTEADIDAGIGARFYF